MGHPLSRYLLSYSTPETRAWEKEAKNSPKDRKAASGGSRGSEIRFPLSSITLLLYSPWGSSSLRLGRDSRNSISFSRSPSLYSLINANGNFSGQGGENIMKSSTKKVLQCPRCTGEGVVREFGMDRYTLLYLKWITNKDLPYSTWNSAQCCVAAWMGGEFGGKLIHVYMWLSSFTVHLKLSQHC